MTTTYESIDLSSTLGAAYASIQRPHDYENAEAVVPVNGDYLIPVQTGDRLSTAQTSSPETATYESIGPLDPADDEAYAGIQIPRHDYITLSC